MTFRELAATTILSIVIVGQAGCGSSTPSRDAGGDSRVDHGGAAGTGGAGGSAGAAGSGVAGAGGMDAGGFDVGAGGTSGTGGAGGSAGADAAAGTAGHDAGSEAGLKDAASDGGAGADGSMGDGPAFDTANDASGDGAGHDSGVGDAPAEGGDAHPGEDAGADVTDAPQQLTVVAIPPYTVSTWAAGTNDYSAPDSIETDGAHVWVGYQNKTTKDGSDGGSGFVADSTIVEYSLDGRDVLKRWSVAGHVDGLRIDPATKNVWITSNEDGAPHLFMISATAQSVTEFTLPLPLPHGGGLDDLGFVNGKLFIAASAPTATSATQNRPALYQVAVTGTTATLTTALPGNGTAKDYNSAATVGLNLTDPDSITIDPAGDLVLISQGDSQVLFVTNPGATATTKVLPVATQLDDTVWATKATGQLLVVDGKANVIYSLQKTGGWTVGTVYTQTPDDSTIPNIVGTLDLSTGNLNPIAVGFGKATGLLFLPN